MIWDGNWLTGVALFSGPCVIDKKPFTSFDIFLARLGMEKN